MSTDSHQRSVEVTAVSDALDRQGDKEGDKTHSYTHCLGHQRGLAATTVQVRGSELQGRVAPSAAQSVHSARCGMGRLCTLGERSASLSSRRLQSPAQGGRRITVTQLQPRRKQSDGWVAGFVSARCSRRTSGDVGHLYPYEESEAPDSGAPIAPDRKSTNKLK